jgi:hypothetical protein
MNAIKVEDGNCIPLPALDVLFDLYLTMTIIVVPGYGNVVLEPNVIR